MAALSTATLCINASIDLATVLQEVVGSARAHRDELLRVLSANVGRAVTSGSLLRRFWSTRRPDDTDPMRTFEKKLRAKPGDDAAPHRHLQRARRRLPHGKTGGQ